MKVTHCTKSILTYATIFLVAWTTVSLFGGGPPVGNTARAGVTVADDSAETVFTSSPDGKTIYMWQYYSSKPPKFVGQAEAVLHESGN
ncbi:MAG: hypothetical protein KDB22_03025 [Planctomycetales bacterium]|nr:hypothetical protein [Planctomycetales bacterium]